MSYSYPISVQVGSAGATIDGEDGLRIVIPANALSSTITLTVAAPITAPTVSGLTAVSRSYAIGPVRTTFARTATVFIPYFSAYESRRSSILVYMGNTPDDPDPGGWTPAPQDLTIAGKMGGNIDSIQCAMAAIPA